MSASPISPELLQAVADGMADAVPFATHTGVVLARVSDGTAVAVLADRPHALNHVATVHAGALFTLAETASGGAMAGTFAPVLFEIRPVVSRASIEYHRPGRGELTATARMGGDPASLRDTLIDDGRVTADVEVVIADATGRDVATFSATWVIKHLAPAPG